METHFTILEHIGTYTTASNNEFNLTRNLHGNVELLQLHFTLQTSSELKYQGVPENGPDGALMIPDDPCLDVFLGAGDAVLSSSMEHGHVLLCHRRDQLQR